MLDTVVISGEYVCRGTPSVCLCLVLSDLTSATSGHQCTSDRVCAKIPGEDRGWYASDALHAVPYVRAHCPAVRGCAVSRRYVH